MIVFPLDTPILADATSDQPESKSLPQLAPARAYASPASRRRQVLARRRKGRAVKVRQENVKRVSFAPEEVWYEYETEFDPQDVYSQEDEMMACRQHCADVLRETHRNDPDYKKQVIHIFRTRNYQYSAQDLDMLNASSCRGLERKLSKIFATHRRWAMEGVLKMQETHNSQTDNGEDCMRFFAKRASQPCVNFARLLAIADRQAANAIYESETDEDFVLATAHYWSDSSRSLESTDSIDTL